MITTNLNKCNLFFKRFFCVILITLAVPGVDAALPQQKISFNTIALAKIQSLKSQDIIADVGGSAKSMEDPLLEEDLLQDSTLEEAEKQKIDPKALGIKAPPTQNKNSEQDPLSGQIQKARTNSNGGSLGPSSRTDLDSGKSLHRKQGLDQNSNPSTADLEPVNKQRSAHSDTDPINSKKSKPHDNNIIFPDFDTIDNSPHWNGKDRRLGFLESNDFGEYFYKEEDSDSGAKEYKDVDHAKPQSRSYERGLKSVTSDGSYIFQIEESELEGSASVRVASMPPLPLESKSGINYEDVYGNSGMTVLLIDYDWLAFKKFGHWVLNIGTGFATKDGPGRFVDDFTEANEVYSLYVLLNHITFIYRFQFSKKPWFVPYVSIGAVPAFLLERRDDNKRSKYALSPSMHGSGGVRFNIGLLDPEGGGQMDAEYGINNMWLDIEFKRLQSLSKEIDISSNLINVGLGFDF